ncbi:hypothetical protein DFH08DRAFT_967404 [Mycena albidolilacea]|uniref:Uncharacterized protein n=1 Tax=Mycena albidolilacea TaxID=1033008 RepID=A0AAD6ZLP8_9AGAR|nr:hypothetical protein DFH08DRAFT_967404 [Mycena albidolilacea]
MTHITLQETHRLFGPINRPAYDTNVRHRAVLQKALELFTPEELEAIFGSPVRLKVTMGFGYSQLGKVKANYIKNDRLVSRETDAPDLKARQALHAYRDAYDVYFKKQGNQYTVRDPQARHLLQAAEQTWHDWIVSYLAARGRHTRVAAHAAPARARVLAAPAPVLVAPAPVLARTPAHARAPVPAVPTPVPAVGSHLRPIDLSHAEAVEDVRTPKKRKLFLGVIDISEDEKALRPRKKGNSWGLLT